MKTTDPRIDKYIENSAPFAKPVLIHLRKLIHQACPGVEEKMKWSFPHFDYQGVFVSMASFREHCAFSFWKSKLMKDPDRLFSGQEEKAMGQLGKIRSLRDLPPDRILLKYLKEAMKLNEDGIRVRPKRPTEKEKKEFPVPAELMAALKKNAKANATFGKFSYSHRKEYIQWITEAKTDATKQKRIETAILWMAEGKDRNWKYK